MSIDCLAVTFEALEMELSRVLGSAPAMRELATRLAHIVSRGGPRIPSILLEGETGTGKSLLASTLHAGSRRRGPFISVNCTAIPRDMLEAELFGHERGAFTGAAGPKPGLFEGAQHGTLFLDEIGHMEPAHQAKLLTVLEERAVRRLGATKPIPLDIWVISATNANLRAACSEGTFLEALFHRIAVVRERLLPLRQRRADIPALAEALLARAAAQFGVSTKTLTPDALRALQTYPFPGNIRELSNLLELVTALPGGPQITRKMLALPCEVEASSAEERVAEDGRGKTASVATTRRGNVILEDPAELRAALVVDKWVVSRTADRLGVPRTTLRARMQRHGLQRGPADAVAGASRPRASAVLESVTLTLRARLLALRPEVRRVLTAVSVTGRTCPLSLLRALLPEEAELEHALAELVSAGLIEICLRDGERALRFVHAMAAEAAQGTLSADELRRLHGDTARALEASHRGDQERLIERLAYHHARGDDPQRAVEVLIVAVSRAIAVNAIDAARADFTMANALLDQLPATEPNRRRRIELHVGEHIVPLFFLPLRAAELLTALEALEGEAHALGDAELLGRFETRKGHCLWWLARLDESIAEERRAIARLEALGRPRLDVYAFIANSYYAAGDFASVLSLEDRILAAIEREQQIRWTVYGVGPLAWTYSARGQHDRAIELSRYGLQLSIERGNPSALSFAHWSYAFVLAGAGELEPAFEHAQRAVEAAPTPGDRVWADCIRCGLLCRTAERAEEGVRRLAPLIQQLRRSSHLSVEDLFTLALGEGYVHLERLDEAHRVFADLRERARRHGMRYLEAAACSWLSLLARQAGAPDDELELRVRQLCDELGLPGSPAELRMRAPRRGAGGT